MLTQEYLQNQMQKLRMKKLADSRQNQTKKQKKMKALILKQKQKILEILAKNVKQR